MAIKELKLKIERLEKELECMKKKSEENKEENECCELGKLRKKLGEIGGAGHFWGNDKDRVRNIMKVDLQYVLRLLELGEKKINFKESVIQALKFKV